MQTAVRVLLGTGSLPGSTACKERHVLQCSHFIFLRLYMKFKSTDFARKVSASWLYNVLILGSSVVEVYLF